MNVLKPLKAELSYSCKSENGKSRLNVHFLETVIATKLETFGNWKPEQIEKIFKAKNGFTYNECAELDLARKMKLCK